MRFVRISVLSLLLLLCSLNLLAQDSVRIVALRPPRSDYFADYSVDSLIGHLNEFNQNKNLRFVRCTEDDSRTGFYADFLVEVSFTFIRPYLAPPQTQRVAEQMPVMRRNAYGQWVTEFRTIYRNVPEPAHTVAGSGRCAIRIVERKTGDNGRMRHIYAANEVRTQHSFLATGEDAEQLELELIVGAVKYLLERFDGR